MGTAGIAVQNFAPLYISMGIAPTLIHRIISISSGVFGVMPHTGLSISYNEVAGMTMKENFKYQFITVNVNHMVTLAIVLVITAFM